MAKYCPSCGEELVDDAKFCKNCGKDLEDIGNVDTTAQQEFNIPAVENKHKILAVFGYIFAFLIPLIAVIISIYLLTRNDSSFDNKHGKYILIVAIIMWILNFIVLFSLSGTFLGLG